MTFLSIWQLATLSLYIRASLPYYKENAYNESMLIAN